MHTHTHTHTHNVSLSNYQIFALSLQNRPVCEIKGSKCMNNQVYCDNYENKNDDDDKTCTSTTLVVYKIACKHQCWNDFFQDGAY